MISEKHCNFIVNLKNAKAHQIEELGQNVKQKVFENSGIQLHWEIERVGNNENLLNMHVLLLKGGKDLKERFP